MSVTEEAAWRSSTNPVLPGFRPDPSVCRVTDADGSVWFYVVNSTFEYLPGLPVHRSRDLVNWEFVGQVITDQLDYAAVGDSGGLYAPTIRHDGHRFLVVCTHLGGPDGASGNFIVTAADPAGPWSAPVWWAESEGIDPSLLIDHDGRIWAHGARAARSPQWPNQGEVWVRELDPGSLLLVGDEHVIWQGALVGATFAEGPHLYRKGKYIYLVAAEAGTERHHAVCAARSTSPAGPFEGHPDNPVLTHRHLGPQAVVVNVGHADLVEAEDGSWWALVLATRLVGGADLLGRETFLVPVQWHDHWPVFAPGVGTLVPEPGGPRAGVRATETEPQWVAVRRLPSAVVDDLEPAVIQSKIRLTAGNSLDDNLPAFVGQALRFPEAEIELAVPDLDAEDEAGLALRQSTREWVTVGRKSGAIVVTQCRDGERAEYARVAVAGAGEVIVRVSGPRAEVAWRNEESVEVPIADLDVRHLTTTHAGRFVGVVVGGYAVGTGRYDLGPLRVAPAGPFST